MRALLSRLEEVSRRLRALPEDSAEETVLTVEGLEELLRQMSFLMFGVPPDRRKQRAFLLHAFKEFEEEIGNVIRGQSDEGTVV